MLIGRVRTGTRPEEEVQSAPPVLRSSEVPQESVRELGGSISLMCTLGEPPSATGDMGRLSLFFVRHTRSKAHHSHHGADGIRVASW